MDYPTYIDLTTVVIETSGPETYTHVKTPSVVPLLPGVSPSALTIHSTSPASCRIHTGIVVEGSPPNPLVRNESIA
jgi:hypothetical protein